MEGIKRAMITSSRLNNKQNNKLLNYLINQKDYIKNDRLWMYTFISLFIKSILFVLIISSYKSLNFPSSYVSIGVYVFFIVGVLSLGFLFPRKAHGIFLIVVNILVTLTMLFDIWLYREFWDFFGWRMLKSIKDLGIHKVILNNISFIDIVFILDIIYFIFRFKKFKNLCKNLRVNIGMFVLTLGLSVSFISWRHYYADKLGNGILFRVCWNAHQTMCNLSPIGYHLYDVYDYEINCKAKELNVKEKNNIESWFKDNKESLPNNVLAGKYKGKNLICIQVESLETFVINQKVNNKEITPCLNKLLKNSLYFSNVYDQVNNGTSSDADLMVNTSLFPVRGGCTFFRYPYKSFNSLPKLLKQQGYSTISTHDEKGSDYNLRNALTSMGFDKCLESKHFVTDEVIGLGLSDGSYLRQVEPFLKKQKQPFYAQVVTLTSHSPFRIPDKYKELGLDKEFDETIMGRYYESIHYTDKQIGTFINKLDKDGILNNSIVVIYGDHCGVHKFHQDEVEKINGLPKWSKDKDQRIPVIIYEKNIKGQEIKTIGGQVDIYTTIAPLLGVDKSKYENTAMGKNLLNTKKNFTVLNNRTIVGTVNSKKEEEHTIEAINIADTLIQSQ